MNALDQVRQALIDGEPTDALAACRARLRDTPDDAAVHYLGAEALRDLGAPGRAERWFDHALDLDPHFSAAWSGRAAVLFDQLRFEEARTSALRAIREDDGNAEAYYMRAMLRERRLDTSGTWRDYRRAAQLDPEQFPLPQVLDDKAVDQAVNEVLELLPEVLRDALERVVIVLEDVPAVEVCADFDPPAPPGELLGLFSGVTVADQAGLDAWSAMPPTIHLFRCNLQRIAWDHDQLLAELRVTLFHEIGHFLGLNEEELHQRGLG